MKGGNNMEEDEKKKLEDEGKEEVGESKDSGEGDKSKTPQTIIDALDAAQRLEKANAEHKRLLDRQTDMISNKILAGTGGGIVETKEISEEQKKVNAAAEYFKDTQLAIDIMKANE